MDSTQTSITEIQKNTHTNPLDFRIKYDIVKILAVVNFWRLPILMSMRRKNDRQ